MPTKSQPNIMIIVTNCNYYLGCRRSSVVSFAPSILIKKNYVYLNDAIWYLAESNFDQLSHSFSSQLSGHLCAKGRMNLGHLVEVLHLEHVPLKFR